MRLQPPWGCSTPSPTSSTTSSSSPTVGTRRGMPTSPERWRQPRPPACTSSPSGWRDRRPTRRRCAPWRAVPEGPTRRSHQRSSVPSTRGSHASSAANTWCEYRSKSPLGTAIRTSVHLPVGSASVGFLAPGASGLRTETRAIAETPGFWAGSLGMGLIALLTFLTVGALGLASLRLDARRRRQRQLSSRLIPRSVEHGWDAEPATGGDRRARMPSQLTLVADRLVDGRSTGQRLARKLEHAGWAIGSGEFLTIVFVGVILLGVLGFVFASALGALPESRSGRSRRSPSCRTRQVGDLRRSRVSLPTR